jgi:hypothetical protein
MSSNNFLVINHNINNVNQLNQTINDIIELFNNILDAFGISLQELYNSTEETIENLVSRFASVDTKIIQDAFDATLPIPRVAMGMHDFLRSNHHNLTGNVVHLLHTKAIDISSTASTIYHLMRYLLNDRNNIGNYTRQR